MIGEAVLTPGLIAEARKLEPRSRSSPMRSRALATCLISAAARPIPLALEGALKLKEAELHPRRRLRAGRTEARADRAHRRGDAGDRDRAARRGVREDRVEHAGGRRRAAGGSSLIGEKRAAEEAVISSSSCAMPT